MQAMSSRAPVANPTFVECGRDTPVVADAATAALLSNLIDENAALQRLALLGSRAAIIAHEINNLMSPIVTRAHYELGRGEGADLRQALERVAASSQKVIEIMKHLLSFSGSSAAEASRFRVADAVDEALTIARAAGRERVETSVTIEPDLCVSARRVLFEQVLLNLILNARTAMKDTGGILTLRARRDNGVALIEVRDTGVGMTPDRIECQVNPFLAAAPDDHADDWRHIGLGLACCRRIVHESGAALRARQNEGRGCTFELRWPAA